jgi:hypothetical protein
MGEIMVGTRLMLGSEHLLLLFTNSRLVVDHAGKRGAGAVAGTSILGRLSVALEDLFKSGSESAARRGIKNMSPGQVLHAHKDNFAIGYGEVVSVTMEQTLTLHKITILTIDDKFEFSTRARFDHVVELLRKTLGDKLIVQRLSPPKQMR